MSDFDDDDSDNFFTSGDEVPKADRPLGLIVGLTARVIRNAKGELIWDELAEMERAYRAKGRAPVIFEEGDGDEPEIGSQP
jgi:hypothetical protein